MPNFKYETVDAAGKTAKGILEAPSMADAAKVLRADGRYISSLESSGGSSILNMKVGSGKLKTKELMIICRQLSSLLSAGITVIRALDMLYQQLETKNAREVIGKIYESIQTGKTLSEAFREHEKVLPDIMVSLIAAGEESGRLDEVMLSLAAHFEKEAKLKNKVGTAMVYPVILLVMTVVITLGLMVGVVPQFATALASMNAKLPALTQAILDFSHSLINFWYVYLFFVLAIVIGIRTFIKSDKGGLFWDRLKLRIPILGKSIRMTASARFTRTMSTLLRSGVNVLEALEITSRTLGNRFLQNKLYDARNEIRKGLSLSRAVRGITELPPMICAMIAIGEESGTLDTILNRAADFFEEEADAATAKVTAAMEPIMIIIMAMVVGTIVAACGAPILSMTKSIM